MRTILHTMAEGRRLFAAFYLNQRGSTAIEYALIASLIAMVIIGAVTGLGDSVLALFTETATAVKLAP